jgi:hypothetical protein
LTWENFNCSAVASGSASPVEAVSVPLVEAVSVPLVDVVLASPVDVVLVALVSPVDVVFTVPVDVALTAPVDVALASPVDSVVASLAEPVPPVGEVPVGVVSVGEGVVPLPLVVELELVVSAVPSDTSGSQPSPRLSHQPIIDIAAIQATLFIASIHLGTRARVR